MKPTPEQLSALKPRDAVVVNMPDGSQQSAIVTGISPAKVRFGWKTSPLTMKEIWLDRDSLPQAILAIFPPGVKFLAV